MLKIMAFFTLASAITFSSCKTTSTNSAALSYPDSYETVCGGLNGYVFTTNPGENKYILEPADGATENIISSLNNQEICVTADFSGKEVIVKSAHYIVAKYETLCGIIEASPTEDGIAGLYDFKTETQSFTVEAGDGAVLNTINSKLGQEICFFADFRTSEVIIESVSNIR